MVTTLSTLNKRKYLDQLDHESPDAVLGNLMSDYHYSLDLKGIVDPCDWLHRCNYRGIKMTAGDRRTIQSRQPMFYNAARHRPVSRRDVMNIIKNL